MTRVNPTVYNSIASLSNEPNTTVVVFSGSDKARLDETFGNLNVWLAAENGIFMRPPPDEDGDQEVCPLPSQSCLLWCNVALCLCPMPFSPTLQSPCKQCHQLSAAENGMFEGRV